MRVCRNPADGTHVMQRLLLCGVQKPERFRHSKVRVRITPRTAQVVRLAPLLATGTQRPSPTWHYDEKALATR
jgi:hypothetical protein